MPAALVQRVLEAHAERWKDAACISAAGKRGYVWIIEPSGGYESGSSVAKMLQVCQSCPVRRECLQQALGERQFASYGVWGASPLTERVRLMPHRGDRRWHEAATLAPLVSRAEQILENTLQARIALWEERGALEQLTRDNGLPRPKGHPTAYLLSRSPPAEGEAEWVKGTSWREERDAGRVSTSG